MKTSITKNISKTTIIFLAVVFLIPQLTQAEIIPPDRRVDWSSAGVKGDIPNNWPDCTTTACNILYGGNVTASTISAALSSASNGSVVRIPAGTFTISSTVYIPSNRILRGAGKGITTLKAASGGSFANGIVVLGNGNNLPWPSMGFGTALDIYSGASKGSSAIQTSTNHGYSVGDLIYIDQLNDPNADPPVTNIGNGGTDTGEGRPGTNGARAQGQMNIVAAGSSGTTINLETPLYVDYTRTPQVTKMAAPYQNSGCEDMTLDNSIYKGRNIGEFFSAANAWFKNVEFYALENTTIGLSAGVRAYYAYRCTVRGCTFHEATDNPSSNTWITDDCYSLYLSPIASANLFEDNEFHHVALAIAFQGACSGNVFAYNYVHDLWHRDQATLGGAVHHHGGHSFMNLVEGNILGSKYNADDYWGSSSQNTVFRNRITIPISPYTSARDDIDLAPLSSYSNIIGNYLGTIGAETTYRAAVLNGNSVAIYGAPDSVLNNTIRHGNWDSVNKSVVWDPNISDHTLPQSLYLSQKPAWYGSCTWPPVDPSGPTVSDIPAKLRYEGKSCGGTTPTCTHGDANSDGSVNISDVQTCINVILGTDTTHQACSDMNGDTNVNITDCQAIINKILSS